MNINFKQYFNTVLDNINDSKVKDAMSYSLFSNGKMLRSELLLTTVRAYGLDETIAYPAASALEMIHTYSLIHDDLPAMDDDDLRRGLNTCHKQFDEATAILAGDALLTEAFSLITNSAINPTANIALVKLLGSSAGANGMILGQCLDIEANNQVDSFEMLKNIHRYKTGKLFAASFMMAATITGNDSDLYVTEQLGYALGLAFQIQDDIFDITLSAEQMGKNTNSDINNNKLTINSFYDLENATTMMNKCYNECVDLITSLNVETTELLSIVDSMKNRVR